jgi:hypothetical protein
MPFKAEIAMMDIPGRVLSDTIAYSRRGTIQDPPVELGGYFQTCDMIQFEDDSQSDGVPRSNGSTAVSIDCCRDTACWRPRTNAITLGLHKTIILGGKTSGTPPTLVDTTSSPQLLAASKMAMQKDSVREQFKKTWPCRKTPATWIWGTETKN